MGRTIVTARQSVGGSGFPGICSRHAELAFESVVAIFELLQDRKKNHSRMEALNDIIVHLYSVSDGKNLEWLQRAFRAGQRPKSVQKMPNCLEALFEQGLEKGLEQGLGKGIEKGVVTGRIRTLQEVLGQSVTSQPDLLKRSLDALHTQVAELESLLRQGPR
ncbi:MAG: hypothetical protein ACK524_08240 [Planctomyces sp.]